MVARDALQSRVSARASLDGRLPRVATPQTAAWSDFEQPYRRERDYSGFGPLTFDRVQYDRALVELTSALAVATRS